jgi:UDP-glucose 4-epimerase
MRIIVTGGAGFIASHIVDAYLSKGHEVFVIDDLSTGKKENLNPKATFHNMGLLDPGLIDLVFKLSPDIVNHHAAQMDVRRSVDNPIFDANTNILGFINLLEGCKKAKVKKVIFASSGGAIYGEQEAFPASEGHPRSPASPYGVSKLAGEHYLAYYQMTFGIPYLALRYSNVYGPRQNPEGEAGVVAIFIRRLLEGKPPTINGDGKQTRDYVFVDDVVAANVAALDCAYTGALNIGTGKETDVITICRLLKEAMKSGVEPVHGPAKPGEQRRSCIDAARAKEVLGWTARTSLQEGLKKTAASYHHG